MADDAVSRSIEGITVRASECREMLEALLTSDSDALAEADKLFFGEKRRYETTGILNYFFVLTSAADRTDGDTLAFCARSKDERFVVLLAPEDHGLVPCQSKIEITPEMIAEGCSAMSIFDRGDPYQEIVHEVYRAMRALERRLPTGGYEGVSCSAGDGGGSC